MQLLSPRDSFDPNSHGGDRTHFFRIERHERLDCLKATFRDHVFPPHTHETYVIGVIESGIHEYLLKGVAIRSRPGDFCFINPDEVHDGRPVDGGYSYRMIYPRESLLRKIASEAMGRPVASPRFAPPVVTDPLLAQEFVGVHRMMEDGAEPLATDEALYRFLVKIIACYGDKRGTGQKAARERRAVEIAKAYLEAHLDAPVSLEALAAAAGLTSYHLIRVFSAETGLTPHAWLVDRRVHAAANRLRRGEPVADVAMACGFADQSHLTRTFKARIGVTPGRFRGSYARAA
jgi:AraC-like DNA-binding protein